MGECEGGGLCTATTGLGGEGGGGLSTGEGGGGGERVGGGADPGEEAWDAVAAKIEKKREKEKELVLA